MDENFFWNVFTNTGSVESYLTYKSAENANSQSTGSGFDSQNKEEKK